MNGSQVIKKKTGPRNGHHSDDARQKMREKWAERKALLEFAKKVKEAHAALEG
jgi:hypothetical protein